ncbi:MAG: hypothetical protein AB7I30_11890 [Isosphaeraceae bacterium]
MTRRMSLLMMNVLMFGVLTFVGCGGGGATTGAAPEAHDSDPTAGHMVHPAGGPDSPEAKKAAESPAK